jgi:hypothetical protein
LAASRFLQRRIPPGVKKMCNIAAGFGDILLVI